MIVVRALALVLAVTRAVTFVSVTLEHVVHTFAYSACKIISVTHTYNWVSVGASRVLSHGCHYWEVVLEKYGQPSLSRKVVIGVISSGFQQWHRCNIFTITSLDTVH